MKKVLAIAKWELLEKIKTKSFVISLILTPVIILTFAAIPAFLSDNQSDSIKVIGVVDTSGVYIDKLRLELDQYRLPDGQPNYIIINLSNESKKISELKYFGDSDVLTNKIEGYLLIVPEKNSVYVEYRSENVANFKDLRRFEEKINSIWINNRLAEEGINPELRKVLANSVEINPIKIETSGDEKEADFSTVFFTALIFLVLLLMMIIYSGQMLVRSLVEEKSNRLIEILISSCTADELLAGKIIGLSMLGLLQVLIWIIIGVLLAGAAVIPLNAFDNILPMLFYFILGFVFYTSIFVGIGSIVTTEQEAQLITGYLSFLLVLPITLVLPAIENPDSLLIQILTYIPLTLPSVMLLRLNLTPIPAEVLIITTLIMIFSIYGTVIITSKIFRIGILSYGKRPSVKELFSWIKEK